MKIDLSNKRHKQFNIYNESDQDFVTPGTQLKSIALKKPDEKAIVYIDKADNRSWISWKELHLMSNSVARMLMEQGFGPGKVALIDYYNSIEHIVAAFGIWKAGGCYMPLSSKTTQREFEQSCQVVTPDVIFSDVHHLKGVPHYTMASFMKELKKYDDSDVEDVWAVPNMISQSGGTCGKPKFVRQNAPSGTGDEILEGWFFMSGMNFDYRQLLVGPLFHGAPHSAAFNGLMSGGTLFIPRDLRAENIVRLIDEFKIQYVQMVPTLMNRIIKIPNLDISKLQSLKSICHTGGYCSPAIKERWLEILSPEQVYEIYAMTEAIGITAIRGDQWLQHYGSVGLPIGNGRITIRDEYFNELPPYEVGEIYMAYKDRCCITEYIGHQQLKSHEGGFRSVGDYGYVDSDGYLYFADRRSDMVNIGGENVYVSDVENALIENDYVVDAIVGGVDDEDLGKKLHAIVQTSENVTEEQLIQFLEERLSPYKIPHSFQFVHCIPRGDNGKVNREKLFHKEKC